MTYAKSLKIQIRGSVQCAFGHWESLNLFMHSLVDESPPMAINRLAGWRVFWNAQPMKLLLSCGCALFLCHCAMPSVGKRDGIDPNPFELLEKQATAGNHDPSRIRVPILRSQELERRWGQPRLLVGPQGGYALRYENPANRAHKLTIFGSPARYPTAGGTAPCYTRLDIDRQLGTLTPVSVKQSWLEVMLAGRSVRYCITDGPQDDQPTLFSTETFRLTAPNGRTASYRLLAAAPGKDPAAAASHLLRTAAF